MVRPSGVAYDRGMSPSRTAPSRRSARAAGALALALALAGGAAGCGSDEGGDTTTAAGGTTAATTTAAGGSTGGGSTGGGGAPAQDEAAIRAAIGRGADAQKAAGTARMTVKTSTAGIETEATGTVDFDEQRFLLDQTVGGAGNETSFQNYGENDKVYIKLPGQGGWSVTDNPAATSDPLAQVRQLQQAKITRVGDTREVGGATCREFEAEMSFAKVIGAIDDPATKQLLESAPKGAAVPVKACIDDQGLTYSSSTSFDLKELLGEQAAQLPSGRSTSEISITDYGSAPSPKRPAGIDDAQPLEGAGGATPPPVSTP